ncbi:MAG: hypothetical protein ACYC7B_14740 [Burkholderiales bacterium]
MQYFVPERRRADKRQAQDVDAEIGERGQAEARGRGAGHHAEFGERIGADLPRVQGEIARHRVEIARREIGDFGMEIGAQAQLGAVCAAHAALLDPVGAGDECDALGGMAELEARAIAPLRQPFFDEPPRHQSALIRGQVEFDAVALQRSFHGRIPARRRGKEGAFAAARRFDVAERIAMIEAGIERGQRAAPAEVDAARRRQANAL